MPAETKHDDGQRERLVFTYTYTSDGDNGEHPQSNTVKVTKTVEEETLPDGMKVLRKKEESQQVSKVTKVEKITRVHRHLIDPLTGELIGEDHPKYQAMIKHESSGGFFSDSYENDAKMLTNGMKHVTINEEFSHGRMYNGNGYNEPENNKINSDEKSMGYDPNDPNLVDEPDLDVENPYEGLGPGRPDPVSRVLMPTAGRHSPDSIGHAPPGYGEDYGTFSRMYAPFGLNEDDYATRKRSPSIDTEFREQRWRDPDLEEVVEYLTHTSDVIKENAAAYLQHLCYNDDNIKSKTRSLNGISYLVALLNHDKVEIQKNACGALRNLCYGKRNDENKIELKKCNGIPALIHLLRRTPYEDVRESVTAVLWNASSSPHLKGQILDEGLNVLVKNIIIPFSGWDADINRRLNPQGKFPPVFKNTTGILRNCSSADYEGRRQMRECEGFIPSLLHAVNSSLQSLNEIDNKSIENCMCVLRNLSYKLQEVIDRDYDRNYPGTMSNHSTWSMTPSHVNDKNKTGCMSSKQKKGKQIYEQIGHHNNQIYAVMPPRQGRPVEMLWQPDVIVTYVHLLRHSSNPDTLEATAGCIQNLTACYWKPSIDLRAEVRKARGLVELVDLLRVEECDSVVNASAIALRNLAIDHKNCDVLGGWAIKELIAVLPDPTEQPSTRRRHSDETIASALAALNEIVRNNENNAKLLFQEGGVHRMKGILNAKPNSYNSKVIKYAAHVLNTMHKHKNLHDFYKQNGYKENDFLHHRSFNSKSLTSSPQSTLHRPRGDMGQPTHFTNKGKQITRPQRTEEYKMQKMNQSVDNLSRTYGNGTMSSHSDPHADLYATVHKSRPHQVQTYNSASPDSWV